MKMQLYDQSKISELLIRIFYVWMQKLGKSILTVFCLFNDGHGTGTKMHLH